MRIFHVGRQVSHRWWLVACCAVTGLSATGGSTLATGAPRTARVSPSFCQSASDAFSSTSNELPSTRAPASISAQYVILLDTVVVAYSRLIGRTPDAGAKSAYARAETYFRRSLGDERSAHAAASSSAQRAAAGQYLVGQGIVIGAAATPYRSCAGLKTVIADQVAETVSWNAIKAAASGHRVVTTSDLRSAANAVAGVRVVNGISGSSRVAKLHVTLARAVSGDYCVLEPTSVRGAPGDVAPC